MQYQHNSSHQQEEPPGLEPLPLTAFLRVVGPLPLQGCHVLFSPSVATLRAEGRKARWSLVIIQMLVLITVIIGLNTLGHHIPGAALHSAATLSVSGIKVFGWLPAPLNMIVFLCTTFFLGLFTAYPFSRLTGGVGTFLEHLSLLLLFTVPLVTITGCDPCPIIHCCHNTRQTVECGRIMSGRR